MLSAGMCELFYTFMPLNCLFVVFHFSGTICCGEAVLRGAERRGSQEEQGGDMSGSANAQEHYEQMLSFEKENMNKVRFHEHSLRKLTLISLLSPRRKANTLHWPLGSVLLRALMVPV